MFHLEECKNKDIMSLSVFLSSLPFSHEIQIFRITNLIIFLPPSLPISPKCSLRTISITLSARSHMALFPLGSGLTPILHLIWYQTGLTSELTESYLSYGAKKIETTPFNPPQDENGTTLQGKRDQIGASPMKGCYLSRLAAS